MKTPLLLLIAVLILPAGCSDGDKVVVTTDSNTSATPDGDGSDGQNDDAGGSVTVVGTSGSTTTVIKLVPEHYGTAVAHRIAAAGIEVFCLDAAADDMLLSVSQEGGDQILALEAGQCGAAELDGPVVLALEHRS